MPNLEKIHPELCAVEWTQQDVPYFSSFIANSWLNDLEDTGQDQRSLHKTNLVGGVWGAVLRWWPPSSMWAGPLIFLWLKGDGWIIPSFQIWDYVPHVEHISGVFTNSGQHQWAILSLEENITRKLLSLSLDLFFKILLFQVTFLIFISIAILSPYFLQVSLLLQYVALFQSEN